MTAAAFSPRLTRILQILGACVLFFLMASGLFYHFMGWKLDGGDLVTICSLIMIYVLLFRSQLRQASDRINELEKRLAALGDTRAVE
jgi:Tfp pilus assembly protein PilN